MEGEALYREVELVAIYRMEGEALYREVGLVVIYRIEGEAFYQEGGWEGGNLPTRGKGFLPRRGWQVAIYRMEREAFYQERDGRNFLQSLILTMIMITERFSKVKCGCTLVMYLGDSAWFILENFAHSLF